MKKTLKSFLLVAFFIFFLGMNANATVTTIDELSVEIDKVQQLADTDFGSFYNRSEMIGRTLSNFNFAASDYRLFNKRVLDNLTKINEMLQKLEESDEYSDSEKERLQSELYQKANDGLNGISGETSNFVNKIGGFMPSITYMRFRQDFIDYYNGLAINGANIEY